MFGRGKIVHVSKYCQEFAMTKHFASRRGKSSSKIQERRKTISNTERYGCERLETRARIEDRSSRTHGIEIAIVREAAAEKRFRRRRVGVKT
jgi:hypothetical protein